MDDSKVEKCRNSDAVSDSVSDIIDIDGNEILEVLRLVSYRKKDDFPVKTHKWNCVDIRTPQRESDETWIMSKVLMC